MNVGTGRNSCRDSNRRSPLSKVTIVPLLFLLRDCEFESLWGWECLWANLSCVKGKHWCSSESSVTRWLHYCSIFGHSQQWQFAKVGAKLFQILNKPFKNFKTLKFCQSDEISPNLVTLIERQEFSKKSSVKGERFALKNFSCWRRRTRELKLWIRIWWIFWKYIL